MRQVLSVRDYIEPMYQMGISIQACGEYAEKDFPDESVAVNRLYCRNKAVADLKKEPEFASILDYPVLCVTWKGGELIIQVG